MFHPKVVKCRNIIYALEMPEASYSFTASETYEPETNQLPSLAIFRIAVQITPYIALPVILV